MLTLSLYPIITTIFYVTYIWPIFFPADLSNSAVRELITSDYYKKVTAPLYDELQRYNNRQAEHGYPAPNREFYFIDTLRGVEVHAQLKLILRDSIDVLNTPNPFGLKQFSYDSTYSIRLSEYYVRIYAAAILLEVFLFLYFFLRIRSGRERDEKVLERFSAWKRMATIEERTSNGEVVENVRELLSRFHAYAKLVSRESADKDTVFTHERDVQRAVHAILRLHFDDVRSEELVPSFAGSGSRIDLFLRNEKIGIEIKMTREGLKDKEVGEQLLIDIARYAEHDKCEVLLCFIYDPRGLLQNAHGLIKNLEERSQEDGLRVRVVVSPA